MTQLKPLVNPKGQIQFGYYDDVERINYLDYDLRSVLDKPRSQLYKRFKFNQFQFISLTCPDLIVGIAIVDLKIAANAFVYLYNPKTQDFEEFSFIQPLARKTFIGLAPNANTAYFDKGDCHIRFAAHQGKRQVEVKIGQKLHISASIDEGDRGYPLQVCSRAGYDGWVFTQKAQALEVAGHVQWQRQGETHRYELAQLNALASVDWSAGYMRRETFWNWASLACHLKDGRRLGFNLAAGVNETGVSENALWLDGKRHKVDMVLFEFDRFDKAGGWRLRSNDGQLDLRFTPAGTRCEKQNKILVVSNFTQFFGTFSGTIKLADETIELDQAWGFTEDHYAKW